LTRRLSSKRAFRHKISQSHQGSGGSGNGNNGNSEMTVQEQLRAVNNGQGSGSSQSQQRDGPSQEDREALHLLRQMQLENLKSVRNNPNNSNNPESNTDGSNEGSNANLKKDTSTAGEGNAKGDDLGLLENLQNLEDFDGGSSIDIDKHIELTSLAGTVGVSRAHSTTLPGGLQEIHTGHHIASAGNKGTSGGSSSSSTSPNAKGAKGKKGQNTSTEDDDINDKKSSGAFDLKIIQKIENFLNLTQTEQISRIQLAHILSPVDDSSLALCDLTFRQLDRLGRGRIGKEEIIKMFKEKKKLKEVENLDNVWEQLSLQIGADGSSHRFPLGGSKINNNVTVGGGGAGNGSDNSPKNKTVSDGKTTSSSTVTSSTSSTDKGIKGTKSVKDGPSKDKKAGATGNKSKKDVKNPGKELGPMMPIQATGVNESKDNPGSPNSKGSGSTVGGLGSALGSGANHNDFNFTLSYRLFLAATLDLHQDKHEKPIEAVFKVLDMFDEGVLTQESWLAVLKPDLFGVKEELRRIDEDEEWEDSGGNSSISGNSSNILGNYGTGELFTKDQLGDDYEIDSNTGKRKLLGPKIVLGTNGGFCSSRSYINTEPEEMLLSIEQRRYQSRVKEEWKRTVEMLPDELDLEGFKNIMFKKK